MLALQKVNAPDSQWRRQWEALVLTPLGVQSPFFLVASSKKRSVSCAAEQRLRRWMRLVWGELGSRSSLGEALELLAAIWDAQVLPFGS